MVLLHKGGVLLLDPIRPFLRRTRRHWNHLLNHYYNTCRLNRANSSPGSTANHQQAAALGWKDSLVSNKAARPEERRCRSRPEGRCCWSALNKTFWIFTWVKFQRSHTPRFSFLGILWGTKTLTWLMPLVLNRQKQSSTVVKLYAAPRMVLAMSAAPEMLRISTRSDAHHNQSGTLRKP